MTRARDPRRPGRRALGALRWGTAAAVVVAAHGAGAWVALNWHPAEAMPNDPPPAVMIELAPLAVAPPAPPQEVAPGPQMTEAQPEVTPDTSTPVEDTPDPTPPTPVDTIEPIKPDPAPVEEAQNVPDVKPDITPPEPPPEVPVPDPPKKDNAAAVLAPPPPPRPKVHKKPPPKKHETERKKPIDPDKPKHRQTTAPPTTLARRSDAAAAPSSGSDSAPSVSPATWKSALMAHLNRYKRYPPGAAGAGTASVAFTITRSGQVLSARLIGSSGDGALDAEAVSLPRRASPVPAPPAGVGGGTIALTVPIRFGR